MIKRRMRYEDVSSSSALLCPVHDFRPVSGERHYGAHFREVIRMESIANLISMLDYVVDSKRKRHITGGLLLSAALLFGSMAITIMSIKDEEDDNE
nr:MAG TPA: hypothetical protein [Caudoviricetes sp.]